MCLEQPVISTTMHQSKEKQQLNSGPQLGSFVPEAKSPQKAAIQPAKSEGWKGLPTVLNDAMFVHRIFMRCQS